MNRIKDLRLQHGWNQEELGARLNVGKGTVSRYENVERGLDTVTINALCDIFGVASDYLLCRSSAPTASMTDEEAALLRAYRAADERARAVVDLTLEPFMKERREGNGGKKNTAAG